MKNLIMLILNLLLTNPSFAEGNTRCEEIGGLMIPIRPQVRFNYYSRDDNGQYHETADAFNEGRSIVVGHQGELGGCYAMVVDENGYVIDGYDDLVILPNRYFESAIVLESAYDANDLMEFVRSSGQDPACEQCLASLGNVRPRPRPEGFQDEVARLIEEAAAEAATERAMEVDPITGFQALDESQIPHTACRNFVQTDGTLGPYGVFVQQYLNNETDDSPLFSNNMPGQAGEGGTCPNWNRFSREQKIHYWAYALASIASDESGCDADARNPEGSDGPALGLLQMPEEKWGEHGFYWRGNNCRAADDMEDARSNIWCSLDILEESMKGRSGIYKNTDGLVGGNIYWEQLRHNDGGDVGPMLATYRACFN